MLAGILIALVLYFASRYFPAGFDDVKFVIDIVAPLVALLIAAFTVDEVVKTITRAQVEMHVANLNAQTAMYTATMSARVAGADPKPGQL